MEFLSSAGVVLVCELVCEFVGSSLDSAAEEQQKDGTLWKISQAAVTAAAGAEPICYFESQPLFRVFKSIVYH